MSMENVLWKNYRECSELTGTDISEYSMIAPDAGKVTIDWGGTELEANVFADLLKRVHGGFFFRGNLYGGLLCRFRCGYQQKNGKRKNILLWIRIE